MTYDATHIFTRIGKLVKHFNQFDTIRDTDLPLMQEEMIDTFTESSNEDDNDLVQAALGRVGAWKGNINTILRQAKRSVDDYIRISLFNKINSTKRDVDDILDDLIREMNDAADKLQQNTVGRTTAARIIQNENAGFISVIDAQPMARDNVQIEIECVDTGDQAAELWEVRAASPKFTSTFDTQAETGEFLDWEALGIGFTINAGNIIQEFNDTLDQLSGWVLYGFTEDNTDKGALHVEIDVPSYGVNRIRLYSDVSKESSELVASGSRVGNGSITITEEENSGISGSVQFDDSYGTVDTDIWLRLPVYIVGDKYRFMTTSADEGVFFTFFRDVYVKEFPIGDFYTATIDDDLAQ